MGSGVSDVSCVASSDLPLSLSGTTSLSLSSSSRASSRPCIYLPDLKVIALTFRGLITVCAGQSLERC